MTSEKSLREVLSRGALAGASFGLASSTVEVFLLTVGKIRVGVGVPTASMATSIALETALGLALGVLASPLLRVRRGELAHLGAVLLAWAGLGVLAGIPDLALHRALLIIPWAVAPLLVVAGRRLARKKRWLPPLVAGVGLAGTLIAPSLASLDSSELRADRPAARSGAPDVVLVVLDTVRADHVSAYGYGRPTTPVFDSLAREGALFLDATAPATWSLPSHASLFSGQFPSSHGAHGEHRFLEPDVPTLAERLAAAGYETRCFTSNPWITDSLGLTRGFAWTDGAFHEGHMGRTQLHGFRLLDRLGLGPADKGGARVADNFEHWAASARDGGAPTFAFVNLVEAHFFYHQVPERFLARFTSGDRGELRALSLRLLEAQFGGEPPDPTTSAGPATDMYDAGVAYADHLLGRVVGALRERGTLDRTVLVVLSDHGELLGEHGGWGHGNSVLEPEVRVPLLVRFPARVRSGMRVREPVSTVGVAATIADLSGIGAPGGMQVGSLVASPDVTLAGPVIAERYAGDTATARAESLERASALMRSDVRLRAYRSGQWKLVQGSDGSIHLFDVAEDPGELHDRSAQDPATVRRLRTELATWRAALGIPSLGGEPSDATPAPLDPETRNRLRALGYVP